MTVNDIIAETKAKLVCGYTEKEWNGRPAAKGGKQKNESQFRYCFSFVLVL